MCFICGDIDGDNRHLGDKWKEMIQLKTLNEAGFVGDMPKDNQKPASRKSESRVLVARENRQTVGNITVENPRMTCRNINVYYGTKHAIKNVSLDIGRNEVIAMIGPSGCGKSTFIRCLNRMNDRIEGCRVTGEITLDEQNIYDKNDQQAHCEIVR